MDFKSGIRNPGVISALAAALLFGSSTPLAKVLLNSVNPWMLAGLLYLGSGVGLTAYRYIRRMPRVVLSRNEMLWFAGSVVSGGIIAPVLLMFGLTRMPASGASLLLNVEGVFTALLAWFVFRENFDRRIAIGLGAIVLGAFVISWPGQARFAGWWPALAILGACFAWALDNNLTRKVSLNDATWISGIKGLIAGIVNMALALMVGASIPAVPALLSAMFLGLIAYGISLALYVVGIRHLGTARAGAYFAVAPFFGAVLAVLMGEPMTTGLLVAGTLMALGTWLHLIERHEHEHTHETIFHDHLHTHDEHHQHEHDHPVAPGTRHQHPHRHEPLTHRHPHFPDAHHTHGH